MKIEKVKSKLEAELSPIKLEVIDESAGHKGHAGYSDESHIFVDIISEKFSGLSLVQRHQLIYKILRDEMPQIHALRINAKDKQ